MIVFGIAAVAKSKNVATPLRKSLKNQGYRYTYTYYKMNGEVIRFLSFFLFKKG